MQELAERGGLEELTAFAAVAELGNFAKAAKKIGRDASVVSKRVSQLERRLGVRLLSRTTRRVALTEVGDLYYRRVQAALGELANAGNEASNFAASPQGLLKVSLPVTFGRQWIAPLLASFLAEHPQIRVDARFSDRIVDVIADGFDVAIRVGVLTDSSLTARKIASYNNILVAAPEYLAAQGAPQTPSDLSDHACLCFTGYASWPDWFLTKDGQRKIVRPAGRLIADNSEVLLMAALAGAGVALLPDWLAGSAVRARTLIRVLPAWAGKRDGGIYAILPPGPLIPTKTRVFVDAVAASISVNAGWVRS
jgi:DNA-binding transcriptional LysR family regulator